MKSSVALKKFLGVFVSLVAFSSVTRAADTPTAIDTNSASAFLSHLQPLQNAQFVSTPEFDHTALVDALNGAKKTIHMGIFGISDQKIADALVAAAHRKVAVAVICDSYCTKSPSKAAIYKQLQDAGVNIVTATTGFTISHWKMFVVDQKRAFISTMNFVTRTGEMRDMGVFITNPDIIAEMVLVFNNDLLNSKNQTALTPTLTQPNLVWSPINSEPKLASLIDSANQTIEIWIENLGERTIHQALKNAAARKVKVRVLTSQCGLGVPSDVAYANVKDLQGAGVDVRGMPFPASADAPYIHAKTIDADHQTVYLGSENFSFNSLTKARELGLIFQDKAVEQEMSALYQKDWAQATEFTAAAPNACSPFTVVDIPAN